MLSIFSFEQIQKNMGLNPFFVNLGFICTLDSPFLCLYNIIKKALYQYCNLYKINQK